MIHRDRWPMRILFTIPHYFRPTREGFHGSHKADPSRRIEGLTLCLSALHQTFGRRQGLLFPPETCARPANEVIRADIETVVCTTGDHHLLANLPRGLCRQHATDADPRLLGYECHAVLGGALGRFDYFCYLEDDILLTDPLFFQKLRWFGSVAGDDAVLQPNRFEQALGAALDKVYADGNIVDPTISPRFQDKTDTPRIEAPLMGIDLVFQRVDNPHSGCFFLSAAQMTTWAAAPYFLDRAAGFWGPLESAATLGIMRTFRVYKPARENAGFLEVRHIDNRYLGRWLQGWDLARASLSD